MSALGCRYSHLNVCGHVPVQCVCGYINLNKCVGMYAIVCCQVYIYMCDMCVHVGCTRTCVQVLTYACAHTWEYASMWLYMCTCMGGVLLCTYIHGRGYMYMWLFDTHVSGVLCPRSSARMFTCVSSCVGLCVHLRDLARPLLRPWKRVAP